MVPGRILESPQVQCRTLVDKLQDGKPWNSTWNMNGREVHTSAAIPAWTILELGGAKGLDDQALVLTKASKLYRVEMGKTAVSTKPCGKSLQENSFDQELGNVFKDLSKEIGLVMVILPKSSAVIRKATHAKVKRLGDLTYGESQSLILPTWQNGKYLTVLIRTANPMCSIYPIDQPK